MIQFVRLKQIFLMLSCVGLTSIQSAQGAIFGGDEEARRQIDSLRQQMTQQQQATANIFARLERIETLLQNGQQLVNLTSQIEFLKSELAKAQGKSDALTQELTNLQRRQQENYIDLDSKIRNLKVTTSQHVTMNQPVTNHGASQQPIEPNSNNGSVDSNTPPNQPLQPVSTPKATIKDSDKKSSIKNATAKTEEKDSDKKSPSAKSGGAKTEAQAYESAYTLFQKGEYQPAMIEFKNFLEQNPKSVYAPSALYWIGYGFYQLKDYKSSITIQQRLISQFPKATKVPDALLNIAAAYSSSGDNDNAKKTYEQILKKYPKTPIAEKAKLRLDSLK